MRLFHWFIIVSLLFTAGSAGQALASEKEESFGKSHALTVYGEPKYGPDFQHFDYVNPDAPKGGKISIGFHVAFNTLNAFAMKGDKAAGSFNSDHYFNQRMRDILFDTLMVMSDDEPQSFYGLIAETVEVAKDYSWAEFVLRPEARWHDGTPLTADDVVFTFEILPEKGDPIFKVLLAQIKQVEKKGPHTVRFHFTEKNLRKLPTIVAQIPIIPKAYYTNPDNPPINESTLVPPMGSGPYKIKNVEQGRVLTYERVKDYWAADLPVRRGQNNFDTIEYVSFRDPTVALEGIKAGQYDLREENSSRNWATAYDTPAAKRGDLITHLLPNKVPPGLQAFTINTNRYPDRRVRQAIALAWDFQWTDANLFYGQYDRNYSYFENTEFASSGLPGEDELALLEPFRDQLPEEVFTEPYIPPNTEADGPTIRENLIKAQALLKEAGYELNDDGVRVHKETGEPLKVTMLYYNHGFIRIFLPFCDNLDRLGIPCTAKITEIAQYQQKLDSKDFDITVWWYNYPNLFYPGSEQRNNFSCQAAETKGTLNQGAICNPAVDFLLDKVESAGSLEELRAASRALDRVLLHNYYHIPQYHLKAFRLVYWNKFHKPEIEPQYNTGVSAWWMKAKEK